MQFDLQTLTDLQGTQLERERLYASERCTNEQVNPAATEEAGQDSNSKLMGKKGVVCSLGADGQVKYSCQRVASTSAASTRESTCWKVRWVASERLNGIKRV